VTKIGDLIKFRFKGSNASNDWSPPALIAEHFDTIAPEDRLYRLKGWSPSHPKLWVALCHGTRCVVNEDVHEIKVLSPAGDTHED